MAQNIFVPTLNTSNILGQPPEPSIEDYPPGYPRFAALTSAHSFFYIFRRFSTLRARMLLCKQDRLSRLEARLERIDLEEPKALFLGSYRRDTNEERQAVLVELDEAMADYDNLLGRTREALRCEAASCRNINNLRDWLGEFGCLAREESAYLWHDDLMSVGPSDPDAVLKVVEGPMEDGIIWLSSVFGKDFRKNVTRDPNMHIFSEGLINILSRLVVAFLLVATLLAPVTIVSLFQSRALRLTVVLLTTTLLVMALSVLARPRVGDLFIAGATYAAVLVAYIAVPP
ncbi:hypothetical protein BDZ45DRAFT_767132 [Acephala macrosclerotiorum]|nr:hypothetical protein BDZ45DRAFT_767132 [Acephala macrosclerotiorum]